MLVTAKMAGGVSMLYMYTADGTLTYSTSLGLNARDEPMAVTSIPEGDSGARQGGYVTGKAAGMLNTKVFHGGASDAFVIKFDANGTVLWTELVGTSGDDVGNGIIADSDGNAYFVGTVGAGLEPQLNVSLSFSTKMVLGGSDGFLIKYGPSGSILWVEMIASASDDVAGAVGLDDGGSVYVTGYTNGSIAGICFSGNEDMFITKVSSGGKTLSLRFIALLSLIGSVLVMSL